LLERDALRLETWGREPLAADDGSEIVRAHNLEPSAARRVSLGSRMTALCLQDNEARCAGLIAREGDPPFMQEVMDELRHLSPVALPIADEDGPSLGVCFGRRSHRVRALRLPNLYPFSGRTCWIWPSSPNTYYGTAAEYPRASVPQRP
jgi:hypothetical protein